jgi:hypothetical protein
MPWSFRPVSAWLQGELAAYALQHGGMQQMFQESWLTRALLYGIMILTLILDLEAR